MSARDPATRNGSAARDRIPAAAIAEEGLLAGLIGGVTVAAFFLVVDLIGGSPFRTPMLLGSMLFLGREASQVADVSAPIVATYTAFHLIAFIALGLAAASGVHTLEKRPHVGAVLLILFVCFEAAFLGFAFALAPTLVPTLGGWLIALANLLSAAAMAGYLLLLRHPRALQQLEHVFDDETPPS